MTEWLASAYLWMKAAHILFAIFLMSGLFMMPRFFIYHQEAPVGSEEDRKWIERERRLKVIILNPSLVVLWIVGLALMVTTQAWTMGWFHLKLVLVLALSGYHGWVVGYAKKLARGERPTKDKTLRILNEVPGMIAVAVVILAVVKPF